MIPDAIAATAPDIAQGRKRTSISLVRALSLAAAPTFAIMALLTAVSGVPDALCSPGGSPLTGMVAMYLLMSTFHLTPWLRLLSSGRKLSPSSSA